MDDAALLHALQSTGVTLSANTGRRLIHALGRDQNGHVEYTELLTFLSVYARDGSAEERAVVAKMLKSMGATLPQRRRWLTALKRRFQSAYRLGNGDSNHIPPAQFLAALRDTGVWLSVVEEAKLMDLIERETAKTQVLPDSEANDTCVRVSYGTFLEIFAKVHVHECCVLIADSLQYH
jgi:hypothetical protein